MKSPLWYWREWLGLRRCDDEDEFTIYVTRVLKTPERLARYTTNTIFYEDEGKNNRWRSVAETLRTKRGNCTEFACLNVFGLRLLGIKAEHLCLYGVNAQGEEKGHAVAAFDLGMDVRGFIEGDKVHKFNDGWPTIAAKIRPDWRLTRNYKFTDEKGNTVKGFGL